MARLGRNQPGARSKRPTGRPTERTISLPELSPLAAVVMAAVDPNPDGDLFGGQPPDVVGGRVDLSEVDTMWLGSSSFVVQQPASGVGGSGISTTDEPSQELAAAPPPTMTRSAPRGRRKLPRARGGMYNARQLWFQFY